MTLTGAQTFDLAEAGPAVQRLFGHAGLRAGQDEVVRLLAEGRDVLAVMPTGSGKSLCYQLPAMLLPGCTLVISPLIALMKDQVDALPPVVRRRTALINSSLSREEIEQTLAGVGHGDYKLIYAAPERLRQQPFLHGLRRAGISLVVVDEAHCLSLWGHDFRPDYLYVRGALDQLGAPRLLALTATATAAIQAELGERLGRPLDRVSTGVLRPNLRLEVRRLANQEAKLRALLEAVQGSSGPAIVYVTSRDQSERLAEFLSRKGISAAYYHAGLETRERAAIQERFMRDAVRVIVATVAFGMGIDKPNVRLIVHFTPSKSLEAYTQESGRAGRDGGPARCLLLWTPADLSNLRRWLREETLSADVLEAVWQALQRLSGERYLLLSQDGLLQALVRQAPSLDETGIRVCLSLLERAGLLIRHQDLPRMFAIVLKGPAPSGPLSRMAAAAHLAPGRNVRVDALTLARQAGLAPEGIEAALLAWQDEGALSYTASPRELLIELQPAPPDLDRGLRALERERLRAGEVRLTQMLDYCEASICRHACINRYFDVHGEPACGVCDICTGQRAPAEAISEPGAALPPDIAPLILDCVRTLPFPLGRTGVTRLLKGSIQSSVRQDRSEFFGRLAAMSEQAIGAAIEALLTDGYLARDESEYRLLSLTRRGMEERPPPIHARASSPTGAGRDRPRGGGPAAAPGAELDVDPRLFEQLRAWRTRTAAAEGIAAYVVFANRTLEAIAAQLPLTREELASISGVGPLKLDRYGGDLLTIVQSHVNAG